MTTLTALVGLRDRQVDRDARAVRDATEALEVAAAQVHAARIGLDAALAFLAAAPRRRLARLGDECAALHLERCTLAVADAERALDDARRTFAAADHAAELARAAWTRAVAKRNVVRGLAEDECRAADRTTERRAENDLAPRRGVPG